MRHGFARAKDHRARQQTGVGWLKDPWRGEARPGETLSTTAKQAGRYGLWALGGVPEPLAR